MSKTPVSVNIPVATNRLDTPSMCGSCAYRSPSTPDEDEMTKWYHAERPLPHPCHERKNGWACKGNVDKFKQLGLSIDENLLGKE